MKLSDRQARQMMFPALLGMAASILRRDRRDFTQISWQGGSGAEALAPHRNKAEFCYALCRGLNARGVVEAGYIVWRFDDLPRGGPPRQCGRR